MSNEQILTNRPTFPAQLDMAHPLTRGLVGCWLLNDGNGLRAFDSSPYANHGSKVSFGKQSSVGLQFDGVNTLINIGQPGILKPPSTIICEVWYKSFTVAGGSRRLFGAFDGANTGFSLLSFNTTGAYFQVGFGASEAEATTGVLAVNQIAHAIGVYDGANVYCYFNGVRGAKSAKTGSPSYANQAIDIGQDALLGNPVAGQIFLVRMWRSIHWSVDWMAQSLFTDPYEMFLR